MFKSSINLIKENSLKFPNRISITIDDNTITYKELVNRVHIFSNYILRHEILLQDFIVVYMDRSIECIISLLSIMNVGCAFVPIDPVHSKSRISYIIKDIAPSLIITSNDLCDDFSYYQEKIIRFEELNFSVNEYELIDIPILPTYVMYVLYTSGTTGKPKGVLVNNKGAENLLNEVKQEWPLEKRILQFASLGFDASLPEWVGTLSKGGTVVMVKNRKLVLGAELLKFVKKQNISFMKMPSAVLATLNHHHAPPMLETVVTAGDACNQELVKKWAINRKFYNCYGPTENSIGSSRAQCFSTDNEVSIGKPVENVYFYILDDNLNPVDINEIGEIYLGGMGVSYGYINRPKLTAEKFIPDPFNGVGSRMYKTGDLACWLPNGEVAFKGRLDNQVKINGYRIEIDEIIKFMKQTQNIVEASIVPVFKEKNQYLLAFYQSGDNSIKEHEIKQKLEENLPYYMIPSKFQKVNKFKLTVNGKVDTRHLKENYNSLFINNQNEQRINRENIKDEELQINKENTKEQKYEKELKIIWEKTLNINSVQYDSNFFEMGATSLDAAILIGEIETKFGIAPSIAELYENPTFKEFNNITKQFIAAFD